MDWSPLAVSVRVSVAATFLTFAAGIPIAYALSKRRFAGKSLAQGLVNLPLVMPPTVLGYFLLVAFGRRSPLGQLYQHITGQPLVFTWEGAALAAAIASSPLLISQARMAFDAVGRDIEDSARVFGASEMQIFFRITLPLARRGVVAGVVLAFARAMGDFGATLMVAGDIPGRTQTMPLAIYDALQIGDTKTLVVLTVVASVATVVFTLVAGRDSGRVL